MNINTLGQLLRFYREKYNFKQERVCSGICSVATLSRVENGSKVVDSLVAEALLGRLGKEALQFEIMLNDQDYEWWTMRQRIQKMVREGAYQEARKELMVYREQMPGSETVHEQFCLCQEIQIQLAEQKPVEQIRDLTYQALKLTKPELDKGEENQQLYNPTELELILQLIHIGYPAWQKENRKQELERLYQYVEKIYSGTQKEKMGSRILLELVDLEQQSENYEQVIRHVDTAVSFISRGRGIDHIAELHFTKAKALARLYQGKSCWCEQEKVCKEECLMAYYVFDIMKQYEEKQKVQQFCEEVIGWHITE